MKIKPSGDFSVIPVEPASPPAKADALMRPEESASLTLAQVVQSSRFVNDLAVNLSPESPTAVQSQLQKNRN